MFYLQSPVGNRTCIPADRTTNGGFRSLQNWQASWFASGTAALAAAVRAALGVRGLEQPEVLLPAYGCPDLVAAVHHAGAKPFFVDLSPDTLRMNPLILDAAIRERPSIAALIGVDLFGCTENWPDIDEICRRNRIVTIRDCAQSLQSREKIDDERTADFLVYSFGRGKPLYLQGGGALLRCADADQDLLAALADVENAVAVRKKWYSGARTRLYNALLEPHVYAMLARMLGDKLGATRYEPLERIERAPDDFAALANTAIDEFWRNHRSQQSELVALLGAFKGQLARWIKVAPHFPGQQQTLLRLPVLLRDRAMRDALQASLLRNGIGATAMYQKPLPFFAGIGNEQGGRSFPMAEDIAGRLLTLPLHARISDRDLHRIRQCFLAFGVQH